MRESWTYELSLWRLIMKTDRPAKKEFMLTAPGMERIIALAYAYGWKPCEEPEIELTPDMTVTRIGDTPGNRYCRMESPAFAKALRRALKDIPDRDTGAALESPNPLDYFSGFRKQLIRDYIAFIEETQGHAGRAQEGETHLGGSRSNGHGGHEPTADNDCKEG